MGPFVLDSTDPITSAEYSQAEENNDYMYSHNVIRPNWYSN